MKRDGEYFRICQKQVTCKGCPLEKDCHEDSHKPNPKIERRCN